MAAFKSVLLLFAVPCLSHKRLRYPQPRDTTTGSRDAGPCGPVSWEEAFENGDVEEWTAGETVEVVIFEQIHHSREPMRLAISGENDEDFESCIWLNHIPQHTTGDATDLVIELTVPDMTCRNCTLQLIGMQTSGRNAGNCCLYHPDCETDDTFEDANCCGGNQYYSCANINIVGGSRPRDEVCKQPHDWAFRNFTCNYFMQEESDNAWTTDGDTGNLKLVTSGSISGLDPTADTHCSTTDLVAVNTQCQSMILAASSGSGSGSGSSSASGSASSANAPSLLQGGDINGEGIFAVIVVLLLAAVIIGTWCLTKNKEGVPGEETHV